MAPRETADGRKVVRAQAKWVRVSPRKARLVVDHIRGRTVPEARTVLAFTQRAAAVDIEKVLRSAVANAEANHGLVGDELRVVAAYVDEGPTLKRHRARARGRVGRIFKRTCHITVGLAEDPRASQRRRRPQGAQEPAAETPEAPAAGGGTPEQAKPKRAARRRAAAQPEEANV
jgi:large subunit ribosomal protein L22